jgi:hypothetical protein
MKSGIVLWSETGEPDCVTIDADSLGRVMYCGSILDTTLIKGFTFTGGYAQGPSPGDEGGGIYIDGASHLLTIADCAVVGNVATCNGGGVYAESNIGTLERCEISGNEAMNNGGGLYCIYDESGMSNCIISRNLAGGEGGGLMFTEFTTTELHNCTIFGNWALQGGGVYCANTGDVIPEFTRTIIAFNESGSAILDPGGNATASCCDIYGNAGGPGDAAAWIGVDGNFAADPAFCDTAGGDFTIDGSSPCVDTLGCGLVGADSIGCGESGIDDRSPPEVSCYFLGPCRPNPFDRISTIHYALPEVGRVSLCIYDARGRLVRTLRGDEVEGPGNRTATWDGRSDGGRLVTSGVYFYRLTAGPFSKTRRMVFLK